MQSKADADSDSDLEPIKIRGFIFMLLWMLNGASDAAFRVQILVDDSSSLQ
jgi:hypothetical protein